MNAPGVRPGTQPIAAMVLAVPFGQQAGARFIAGGDSSFRPLPPGAPDRLIPTPPFTFPLQLAGSSIPPAPAPPRGNSSDPPSGAGDGSGGGGRTKKGPEFNIAEARKAVAKGNIFGALMYLEAIAGVSIKEGDREWAIACLDEARRIILEANNPEHFDWELSFAAHNDHLGRAEEAEEIFLRVRGHIPNSPDQHRRDEIRFAMAMTYKKLGRTEAALEISDTIEEAGSRFGACREIANVLEANEAEQCLLERCVPAALAFSKRYSKVDCLLQLAEDLIKIEKRESAKKILDQATGQMDAVRDSDRAWEELMERAGKMLIDLGYREEVIVFLTRGWLNEKHPSFNDPQALRQARLEVIRGRYPNLAKFFEGGVS